MKDHLKKKIIWISSVIGTAIIISFTTNFSQNVLATSNGNKPYEDLKIFTEVFHKVKENYVDDTDTKKLIEGALNGMLVTLDPHSSFMDKDMYKEMQIETQGEFAGLGIEITIKDGLLTVVSPIDDTPAFAAGIKAGDKIVKIDGSNTRDLSLNDAVKKLRGEKGSKVVITIFRQDMEKPEDITIIRDIIKIKSVKYEDISDGNIGYIKITKFSKSTADDIDAAISALNKKGVNSFILDLRNNPGGLLDQAVEVSSRFLSKGDLIVYTKGRKSDQNLKFESQSNGKVDMAHPVVILVNEGSASASEIVAGALQDNKRAVIIGTQTFGKGSVQTIIQLAEGSGLRLTTAKYYTPSGRVIHEKGVIPDIVVNAERHPVKDTKDDKDLEKHIIREKDLTGANGDIGSAITKPKPEDGAEVKPQDEPNKDTEAKEIKEEEDKFKDDAQLKSAINLLKGWSIIKDRKM